jgi:hypothetical protein
MSEHIPPVIGEYAYFDYRRREKEIQYIVSIKGKPESCRGCIYSLPYKKENEPFITCHEAVIDKIIKIIPNNNKDIN